MPIVVVALLALAVWRAVGVPILGVNDGNSMGAHSRTRPRPANTTSIPLLRELSSTNRARVRSCQRVAPTADATTWAYSQHNMQWWFRYGHPPASCIKRFRRLLTTEFMHMNGLCDGLIEALPTIDASAYATPKRCANLSKSVAGSSSAARIVFFLDVRGHTEHLRRLLGALHHPSNYYIVQVDRSNAALSAKVVVLARAYHNVCVMHYDDVVRFTGGIARVALRAMQWAVQHLSNYPWSHFVTLSGMDYPLFSPKELQNILAERSHLSFFPSPDDTHANSERRTQFSMGCDKSPLIWNGRSSWGWRWVDHRYTKPHATGNAFPWLDRGGRLRGAVRWVKLGGFANVLSFPFVHYAVASPLALKLWAFFAHTPVADEHFLPTLFFNSPHFRLDAGSNASSANAGSGGSSRRTAADQWLSTGTSACYMRWGPAPKAGHNVVLTYTYWYMLHKERVAWERTVRRWRRKTNASGGTSQATPPHLFVRRVDTAVPASARLLDLIDKHLLT